MLNIPIESIEYKGCLIDIYPDDTPSNPRDYDNLGTMVCFHRRYNLGDTHDFPNPSEFEEFLQHEKNLLAIPLFLYDHSGITISTTPFACPFDSGRVGSIYVTYETLRKEYGVKNITKKIIERATLCLHSEVITYRKYLRGECYGYEITVNNTDVGVGSCWGYYDMDYAVEEAKLAIDAYECTSLPLLAHAGIILT
jgi:hypothetical protein